MSSTLPFLTTSVHFSLTLSNRRHSWSHLLKTLDYLLHFPPMLLSINQSTYILKQQFSKLQRLWGQLTKDLMCSWTHTISSSKQKIFVRIITLWWKWCSICPVKYNIHNMWLIGPHLGFNFINFKLSFFWNLSNTPSRFLKKKDNVRIGMKQMYLMYCNEGKMNSVCNIRVSILQQVDSSIIDWSMIWLIDWLTDWLADWLTNWLTDQPTDRLTD